MLPLSVDRADVVRVGVGGFTMRHVAAVATALFFLRPACLDAALPELLGLIVNLVQDNNWLLLEFAMALPFAVGFKTAAVSRALALTLVLEALTCWPLWADWPSV